MTAHSRLEEGIIVRIRKKKQKRAILTIEIDSLRDYLTDRTPILTDEVDEIMNDLIEMAITYDGIYDPKRYIGRW